MKENGVIRRRLSGKEADPYIGLGRKILGEMKNIMQMGGIKQLNWTKDLQNGVRIVVSSIFGQDEVRIFVPVPNPLPLLPQALEIELPRLRQFLFAMANNNLVQFDLTYGDTPIMGKSILTIAANENQGELAFDFERGHICVFDRHYINGQPSCEFVEVDTGRVISEQRVTINTASGGSVGVVAGKGMAYAIFERAGEVNLCSFSLNGDKNNVVNLTGLGIQDIWGIGFDKTTETILILQCSNYSVGTVWQHLQIDPTTGEVLSTVEDDQNEYYAIYHHFWERKQRFMLGGLLTPDIVNRTRTITLDNAGLHSSFIGSNDQDYFYNIAEPQTGAHIIFDHTHLHITGDYAQTISIGTGYYYMFTDEHGVFFNYIENPSTITWRNIATGNTGVLDNTLFNTSDYGFGREWYSVYGEIQTKDTEKIL